MIEPKIITCTGYGATGSSVITDLLKEFSNVKSMGDFEFSIAHEVDGISDLQHAIVDDFNRNRVSEALYRFKVLTKNIEKPYNAFFNNKFTPLTQEYIDTLTDVTWKGFWHQHLWRETMFKRRILYSIPTRIQLYTHNLLGQKTGYEFVPWQRKDDICISYGEEKFFNATRSYFNSLFEQIELESKIDYIAFDQLVPCYSLERYLNYFDSIKVIVVDRDPRDLYLLNKLFWHEGWIPSHDINIFIKWFDLIRQHQKKEISNANIIKVNFEDFIYRYDETIDKIINFLSLSSENHIHKFRYFNPNISKKNTKIFEMYDLYSEDIKLINRILGKYCYGFS